MTSFDSRMSSATTVIRCFVGRTSGVGEQRRDLRGRGHAPTVAGVENGSQLAVCSERAENRSHRAALLALAGCWRAVGRLGSSQRRRGRSIRSPSRPSRSAGSTSMAKPDARRRRAARLRADASDDVKAVQQADVVLYLGGGFQPALETRARPRRDARSTSSRTASASSDERPARLARPGAATRRSSSRDRRRARRAGRGRRLAGAGSTRSTPSSAPASRTASGARSSRATRRSATSPTRYGLEQVPIAGLAPEAEAGPRDSSASSTCVRATARRRSSSRRSSRRGSPRRSPARPASRSPMLDPIEG